MIKDSWVNVNRPKEGDTLSKILNDASNDERAMFLTVLVHGVVTIDGREDLMQDLHMNGYLVSTDVDSHKLNNKRGGNLLPELEERMAKAGITDRGSVEDTTQGDHIYRASIFEVLRASKPSSQQSTLDLLLRSPHVSVCYKAKHPPRVYGPKAHYRIVF